MAALSTHPLPLLTKMLLWPLVTIFPFDRNILWSKTLSPLSIFLCWTELHRSLDMWPWGQTQEGQRQRQRRMRPPVSFAKCQISAWQRRPASTLGDMLRGRHPPSADGWRAASLFIYSFSIRNAVLSQHFTEETKCGLLYPPTLEVLLSGQEQSVELLIEMHIQRGLGQPPFLVFHV